MSDYQTIKEQTTEIERLRGLLRATAMNLGRPDAEPEDVPGLALAITRQLAEAVGMAAQAPAAQSIEWGFNDVNQLEARPTGARLIVTDWDENSARCKLMSTRHGGEWLVASITVHARSGTNTQGGGVLCEAREVMSAIYWSWRRSSGPGGGADDALPERPLPRGDYKGRLRHG